MAPLSVGIVPFLNARPLTHGLERRSDIFLDTDVPAALIERLRAGDLDIALVSSIELFRRDGYRMLPGLGVASRGPVESVLLFGRRPIEAAQSLSLDTSSRSGEALARIVLEQFHHRPPLAIRYDAPTAELHQVEADLALRIGDPALRTARASFATVVDLGEQWTQHTGLPFVYAVWIVRPGAKLQGREHLFYEARAAGRAALRSIATAAASQLDLPFASMMHYLEHCVQHDLGPAHMTALAEFRDRAARLGMARADLAVALQPVRENVVERS
ncbi:MAG: menaquinone biosynthesis protein [Planctomycetota bacterium]